MCNNLCYLVEAFQEIYFTVLIVLRGGCYRQKSENLNIFALPTVRLFLLLQTTEDDIENQSEIICLISNKQSLWKSNRDKICFF